MTKRPLLHQTTVRLHVGTAEAIGKLHLLESRRIEPGETTFVQFRLDDPVVACPGDRYVARLHSPMETIGGGEILDRSHWRLKVGKEYVLAGLRDKEEVLGDSRKFLLHTIRAAGFEAVPEKDLAVRSGLPLEEARTFLESLLEEGEIVRAKRAGLVLSTERMEEARERARQIAADYYRRHRRRLFMEKAYLRQKLKCHEVFLQDLLTRLEQAGEIESSKAGRIRWRDFGPRLDKEDEEKKNAIREAVLAARSTPPSPADLAGEHGWDEAKTQELYDLLEEEGSLQKFAEGIYLHCDVVEESRRLLREYLEEHGSVTSSNAKTLLGSTRKYVIPILEQFDREGFTVRKGDVRELRDKK